MPMLEKGEREYCQQCRKEIIVDEKTRWLCISEVGMGYEENWVYLCSYECLQKYATPEVECVPVKAEQFFYNVDGR